MICKNCKKEIEEVEDHHGKFWVHADTGYTICHHPILEAEPLEGVE
jgi:hypothetical protein